MQITESSFNEVLPIWKNHLWPQRKSAIEAHSCITLYGGYNLDYSSHHIDFWTVKYNQKVVATLSGFVTEPNEYRIRGLYVLPEYRREGLGSLLVKQAVQKASAKGFDLIWTLPRLTSWDFYQRQGFQADSNWFDFSMEFGPNCFATLDLKTQIL